MSVNSLNRYKPIIRRIGVIGGTFDPVHYGHLVIAEEVCAALELEKMVFVPTGLPPHKPARVVTAPEHRVAMLERAIADNPRFSLSMVDVDRAGPSYTVETLRLLRRQWEVEAAPGRGMAVDQQVVTGTRSGERDGDRGQREFDRWHGHPPFVTRLRKPQALAPVRPLPRPIRFRLAASVRAPGRRRGPGNGSEVRR